MRPGSLIGSVLGGMAVLFACAPKDPSGVNLTIRFAAATTTTFDHVRLEVKLANGKRAGACLYPSSTTDVARAIVADAGPFTCADQVADAGAVFPFPWSANRVVNVEADEGESLGIDVFVGLGGHEIPVSHLDVVAKPGYATAATTIAVDAGTPAACTSGVHLVALQSGAVDATCGPTACQPSATTQQIVHADDVTCGGASGHGAIVPPPTTASSCATGDTYQRFALRRQIGETVFAFTFTGHFARCREGDPTSCTTDCDPPQTTFTLSRPFTASTPPVVADLTCIAPSLEDATYFVGDIPGGKSLGYVDFVLTQKLPTDPARACTLVIDHYSTTTSEP